MMRGRTFRIVSLFLFGVFLLIEEGCRKDQGERRELGGKKVTILSLEELRAKAEAGDADAQYSLGMIFEEGAGVEKDEKEAAQWYEKAAAKGHAPARTELAILYSQGRGVERDKQKGLALYLESAKQGDALAQYYLGVSYQTGWLGVKDDDKAVQWLSKAHEQGLLWATFQLGEMYQKGEGVEKDLLKAMECYEKALAKLDSWSFYGKECMYATHDLCEIIREQKGDNRKGVLAKGEGNLRKVFFQLGKDSMRINDLDESYKWMLLAGLFGQEVNAAKQEIKERSTDLQIQRAEKLAVEYLRKRKGLGFEDKVHEGQILTYEIPEMIWEDIPVISVPARKEQEKENWKFQAVRDDRCLYLRFIYRDSLPAIGRNVLGEVGEEDGYLANMPDIQIMCPPDSQESYRERIVTKYPDGAVLISGRPKDTRTLWEINPYFSVHMHSEEGKKHVRSRTAPSYNREDFQLDCDSIRFTLQVILRQQVYEPERKVKTRMTLQYRGEWEGNIYSSATMGKWNFEGTNGICNLSLGNYSNLFVYGDQSFIVRVPLTQGMTWGDIHITGLMEKPMPEMSLRVMSYGANQFVIYYPKKVDLESGEK